MPVRHGQTPVRRLHLPESEPLWRAGRGFVVRDLPWMLGLCAASSSGAAPGRFGTGAMTDWARRLVAGMLGDDGNQMMADGNSFPEFIFGWTIGVAADRVR